MKNPDKLEYFQKLQKLVRALENKKSLRDIQDGEKELYQLFKRSLTKKNTLKNIDYDHKKTFFECFYFWPNFYDTVGGNHHTVSNIELKTYPYFYVHKPTKTEHNSMTKNLAKKLGILDDDYKKIKAKANKIDGNVKKRKEIINFFKSQMIKGDEINQDKVFEFYELLFPYNIIPREDVKIIFTQTSMFFVIPSLKHIKQKSYFKKASKTKKDKILKFYKLVQGFHFRYFENFPTFSIFNINEVDEKIVKKWASKVNLNINEFKHLMNSQTMLHFDETIEQYMIHDTWGHIWQAELGNGKYYYDKLANRRVPFYPERTITINNDVVSFCDLFYLDFKGELHFNDSYASEYIYNYFQESMMLHYYAIMSELCAEVTEFLFVFDYGSDIPLSSSSKFNHNPAKLDFAWSDVNYFSRMLNTPFLPLKKNKNEFTEFVSKLEVLLEGRFKNRFDYLGKKINMKKDIRVYCERFLDLFEKEFNSRFGKPVKKYNDENFVLSIFYQILKIHSVVNNLFEEYFGEEGKELAQYRIIALMYLYKLFEVDPREKFWDLDDFFNDEIVILLKAIK